MSVEEFETAHSGPIRLHPVRDERVDDMGDGVRRKLLIPQRVENRQSQLVGLWDGRDELVEDTLELFMG